MGKWVANALSLTVDQDAVLHLIADDISISIAFPVYLAYFLTMTRDRAPNTLRRARTLTLTTNAQGFKDFVGTTDAGDLYQFRLDGRSGVDLSLSQIASNAAVGLELYQLKGNSQGVLRRIGNIPFSTLKLRDIRNQLTRIAALVQRSGSKQGITRILEAGTYYLRVYPRRGSSTYTLTRSAVGIGSMVVAPDFSTWTAIGDAIVPVNSRGVVTLTNARSGDDPTNVGNLNVSGVEPLTSFGVGAQNFAQAIGLTSDQLDQGIGSVSSGNLGYQEGSAIRNTAIAANAGETLVFNWRFSVKDPVDVGFVKVGSNLFRLEGSSLFSYTFPTTGVYDVAIGVVDVNDFSGSSILQITNLT